MLIQVVSIVHPKLLIFYDGGYDDTKRQVDANDTTSKRKFSKTKHLQLLPVVAWECGSYGGQFRAVFRRTMCTDMY